jgi:hypothetical protein
MMRQQLEIQFLYFGAKIPETRRLFLCHWMRNATGGRHVVLGTTKEFSTKMGFFLDWAKGSRRGMEAYSPFAMPDQVFEMVERARDAYNSQNKGADFDFFMILCTRIINIFEKNLSIDEIAERCDDFIPKYTVSVVLSGLHRENFIELLSLPTLNDIYYEKEVGMKFLEKGIEYAKTKGIEMGIQP